MKSLRETIRAILRDDALYRRKDLPGDLDDPMIHGEYCTCQICQQGEHQDSPEDCGCGCEKCQKGSDFVNPKYALYSLIGDAISIYDSMDDEKFDDDEMNHSVMSAAAQIRSMLG